MLSNKAYKIFGKKQSSTRLFGLDKSLGIVDIIIFDNITPGSTLLPVLQHTIETAYRADFCVDNATATRLKHQLAQELREQLTIGAPTNEDEAALQQLALQIRAGSCLTT